MAEMMNTREVAQYLHIRERKVYDLVRQGRIPSTRVTGKWLFPKELIDRWVIDSAAVGEAAVRSERPPPPTVAGSHDPLLEWALREADCRLALLAGGSLDGLQRLAAGEAMVCGCHVYDPDSGDYNVPAVKTALTWQDVVVLEWGWREQGLVVAVGNPLGLRAMPDVAERKARVVLRQGEAGSRLLFGHLLAAAGVALDDLVLLPRPARSETDIGLAVREGKADTGLAIAAVAQQLGLDFLPLHRERFDLVMRRRDYFEPPIQRLFDFARSPAFVTRAAEMGGYDVHGLGRVHYNAP